MAKQYSSISQETILTAPLNTSSTTVVVQSSTLLMGDVTLGPGDKYTVVIDPDTANEEICYVTNVDSPTQITVERGRDNTSTVSHAVGAKVRHMAVGADFKDLEAHRNASTGVHGVSGSVVGTQGAQTLEDKTLTNPIIGSFQAANHDHQSSAGGGTLTSTAITDFAEAAQDAAGAAIAAGTQSGITVTYSDSTNAVSFSVDDDYVKNTGDTMTGILNMGSNKIQNMAEPTSSHDAATKNYVDTADGTLVPKTRTVSVSGALNGGGNLSSDITVGLETGYGLELVALIGGPPTVVVDTDVIASKSYVDSNTVASAGDTMSGNLNMNSNKVTNLATPTDNGDAANKSYADARETAAKSYADSTFIPTAQKGAANGVATLDSTGKIPASELPSLAIAETFVVNSESAMLALTAQTGDIAVRTDVNKSFILEGLPASTLGNWVELLSPTDAVQSVDGRTGTVTLTDLYDAAGSAAARVAKSGDTMSGALNMGGNKITSLGTPTATTDAATKDYVDTVVVAPSNLTGVITSVGNVTSTGAQTGTGSTFVMQTSPTLITPDIGVATATSINGTTIPSSVNLVKDTDTALLVPSQTTHAGKYLTTNGTSTSWQTVDALPSQTGNAGKYLTTDGTTASWQTVAVSSDPTPTVFLLMGA